MANIQFHRSKIKTDASFLDLINRNFGVNFTSALDAKDWLNKNGYPNGYPDVVTSGLTLMYDISNENSYKFKERLYDDSIWSDGQTNGVGMFTSYSSNNRRVISTDPWGDNVVVWEAYSRSGTTTGGGIYMSTLPIDNTKKYRMSWWENRAANSTLQANYYAGLHGYGAVNGVGNLSNETPNTNPYFWSTSYNGLTENQWFLIVGHVHPYTYIGTTSTESGRYIINGTKIGNISTDYRWLSSTTTARSRTLMVYATDSGLTTNNVLHHTLYPRLDLCDGTEPSLNDLIYNVPNTIYDLSGNENYGKLLSSPKYDANYNGSLTFNGSKLIDVSTIDSHPSPSKMTISAWFYMTGGVSTYRCVLHKGPDTSVGTSRYWIGISGANTLVATIGSYTAGGWSMGDTLIPATLNTWYNLTATWDGSIVYVYVNGVYNKQYSLTSFDNVGVSKIGSSAITGISYQVVGNISNIQIYYNNGLTSTEVQQNYDALKSRYEF